MISKDPEPTMLVRAAVPYELVDLGHTAEIRILGLQKREPRFYREETETCLGILRAGADEFKSRFPRSPPSKFDIDNVIKALEKLVA